MRRTYLFALLAGVGITLIVATILMHGSTPRPGLTAAEPAKAEPAAKPPAPQLPIARAILFSSGVGYFQREGQVEGNAKIDLTFPVQNINDLLKSMVLQDLDGGKISTVNYDSHDPINKTLQSFAINLSGNPSFGQLLNQARGEKVEIVLQQSNATQAGTLSGTIVGVEQQKQPVNKEAVVEVEFLNVMTADGLRSIRLADVQRLRFVNPLMDKELGHALEVLARSHDTQKKAVSLSFTGEGKRQVRVGYVVENPIWKTSYRLVLDKKEKPFLQGWAVVENPSDEDWKDVRMALVSGRPISFQMDLYQPLYVPRPVVEPELFASLRPQTYTGAMGGKDMPAAAWGNWAASPGYPSAICKPSDAASPAWAARQLTAVQRVALTVAFENKAEKLDLARGVASAASAANLGDFFEYVIDQPVNLPRQKSAMLPIVNKEIEASRVSIYNEGTLAKYPLLGLKFKNTTGLHLMQGPITIFEASSYAGDARILDLEPKEERLISYAIDLGTEVDPVAKHEPDRLLSVKIDKGILIATNKMRDSKTYNIKNRSDQDRTLLIEHPFRADYKLVDTEKPAEQARDVYRFEVKVAAGKTASLPVTEERDLINRIALTDSPDDTVRIFLASNVSSEKVQAALKHALELKGKLEATRGERNRQKADLDAIVQEQGRLRANLERVPQNSDLYKRYLEKLGNQETDIEKLQAQIKKLDETEKQQLNDYRGYLSSLSVE